MASFSQVFCLISFTLFLSTKGYAQATVFLRAGGNITTPGDWGTSTDGLSGTLSDFSQNNTYNFTSNNSTRTLSAAWNITAGSTVVLGDGVSGFTLTYSGSATMGSTPANVTMSNLSYLLLNTNYNLDASKTTLNSGSTIEYASGTTSVSSDIYSDLTINENISTNSSNIVVQGHLLISSSKILTFNNSSNLALNGTSTYNGSVSGDGTGTVTINGSNNLSFTTGNESIGSLIINNSGSLLSNVIVSSTFSLELGILTLNGFNLILNGNINFKSNSSAVIRGNSTSSITIGGSGSITNNLIMDNTNSSTQTLDELVMSRSGATLTLANTLRIRSSITPSVGTIDVGSNLILEANASTKARIGIITASGALTGSPTVNVFKPAGFTGWVNLCSGGVNGNTMANWNSSFPITCPTCPDGSTANNVAFTSIYSYDETATTGSASAAAHYIGIPNITTSIDSKTGYWVYLGDGYPSTSAITIPLTGSVNTKNSSGNFNLTMSAGAANTEDGWNLIANPYPSPIQVSQFISSAGGANIDNTLLVYDPDTDSNVPLTTGNVIPMGQAFMVRALVNNTSVTPDESWKTATADNTSIQKQFAENGAVGSNGRAYYFNEFLIDLQSTDVAKNFFTQAYFSFGNGGTSGFDNGKDAYSLESSVDPGTPRLFSLSNNECFLRNALPSVYGTLSIPLKVVTGYPGTYKLLPVNLSKLPSGACVVLYDLINNVHHDLRTGPYTTSLNVSTSQSAPQFELIITSLPSSLSASSKDPLCSHSQDGFLVAKGSGTGPWNYTWKNENNSVLKYSANHSGADSLKFLEQGIYKVDVNPVGTCKTASQQFTLEALTPLPEANFSANTTSVYAQSDVPISFTNLSHNASEFTWEFGNGMSVSSLHANYTYNTPGLYTVKLTAGNGPCQDVDQKSLQVQVLDMPVGIGQHEFMSEELVLVQESNSIYILVNSNENQSFTLSAYNALGQQLIKEKTVQPVNGRIDIQIPTSGNLLFVKLSNENKSKTFKLVH